MDDQQADRVRFEATQSLQGRVAVVTGAASGLGAAMARRFAGAGLRLVLADVEAEPLGEIAAELASSGAQVGSMVVDVRDPVAVEALAEFAYAHFDEVAILCNNAGVATGGLTWDLTGADWQWVLGVNLWGVINGVRAFIPRMIAGGRSGHVVNTGSMTSLLAMPNLATYGASKAAVASLSETLALDLAAVSADIGVSVLCPGYIGTRIRDSARNRPTELPAGVSRPRRHSTDGVEPQMTAADVADAVVEAILHQQFWIVTHTAYGPLIEARAATIASGGQPRVWPVW